MAWMGMGFWLAVLACTACGGASRSDPPEPPLVETPPEGFIASCERYCGLLERLSLLVPCERGEAIRHGERLGSGKIPEEPPLSDDPECMAICLEPGPMRVECWEQREAMNDCSASAVWICDRAGWGWNMAQTACGVLAADPAICWEEG
jgi:hypothetical protein